MNKGYTCKDFFGSIFGHPIIKNMYMYTWSPGHRGGSTASHRCSEIETACRRVDKRNDAYFGLAVTYQPLKINERAKAKEIDGITCLWLDIDFDSPYRSKERLPKDLNDIKPILESMPPATWWVDSGYGFHCYWVLDEPFIARTQLDRGTIGLTVKRWNTIFKRKFNEAGFDLDSTSPAQILRVPGTFNTKNPEERKLVEVVSYSEETYDFDSLFELTYSLAGDVKDIDNVTINYNGTFNIDTKACISDDIMDLIEDALPKFKVIWSGDREYPSQSERDLAIATQLKSIGLDDQTIVDAMIQNRRELGGSIAKEKIRPDYFMRTLSKAASSDMVMSTKVKVNQILARESNETVFKDDDDEPQADSEALEEARSVIEDLVGVKFRKLIKLCTTPPRYELKFSAGPLNASIIFPSIKDLTNQKFFRDRVMEVTNSYFNPMNKKKWEKLMTVLLPLSEDQDMGDVGTDTGEFMMKVNMFLDAIGCTLDNDTDDMKKVGAFYRIDEGDKVYVYIRPMSFMSWHNREGFPERLNAQQICIHLINAGAKSSRAKGQSLMKIPGYLSADGVGV